MGRAPRAKTLIDEPPPHSLEAEMALLGAMILAPDEIPGVAAALPGPAVFFGWANAAVYAAILTAHEQGGSANMLAVMETLRDRWALADAGGVAYIEKLARETPGPATIDVQVRTVLDKYRRRLLVEAATRLASDAIERLEDSVADIATTAMDRLAAATTATTETTIVDMRTACARVFDAISAGKPSCWPTGFPSVDAAFGGFPVAGVTTIVGLPSNGKTTWTLQAVSQMCEIHKIRAAVFSNEQQADRIAATLLSMKAGVGVHDMLNRGEVRSQHAYERVQRARRIVEALPIDLVEDPMHAGQIVAQTKALARKGTRIVVVDYLQDLPPPPGMVKGEERITESMRQLKRIGRELGLAVVVVSQLGKDVGKDKRRPTKFDGLYSSAIEQASDVMIGVWRPHMDEPFPAGQGEMVAEDWRERTRRTQLLWLKNKYGPLGEVDMRYVPEAMTFEDEGVPAA